MKKLIKLSLFLFLFLGVKQSHATHMAGGEISYKALDSLKFEVTLTWYRDCGGIALGAANTLSVSCSGGSTNTMTLSLVSITDITPVCASEPLPCVPVNTLITGSGIEKHICRGIVDFNTSPMSFLASCSSQIVFSSFVNARSSAITTGPTGTLYIEALLDLANAPKNSSVVLTNNNPIFGCCSQPVVFNMGASDFIDGDSLSYSWELPKSAYNQNVNFGGTYSFANPLTAFYSSPALSFPFNDPTASPPMGIYLDPITGDLIFTPTDCNEATVLVLSVTEWRDDTAGIPRIIGKVTRETLFIVSTCPTNNPPSVSGQLYHTVCEEDELCFDITTSDQISVQPGPNPIPSLLDTLDLTWSENIPGATFTILDTTAALKTGRFCWTPPTGSASVLPYTFVARVEDDNCPRRAEASRGYRILVNPRAKAEINIVEKDCGWFEIDAVNATASGLETFYWSILDSNGIVLPETSTAFFSSTTDFNSSQQSDSLKIQREGTYILQLSLNNPPTNCPAVFYDTIVIGPITTAVIDLPADTGVCSNASFDITTTTTNASGRVAYQWYLDDNIIPNDTLQTFEVLNFTEIESIYTLIITDTAGCTNSDNVLVQSSYNLIDTLQTDYFACAGDTIALSLDSTLTSISWSNGSTSPFINVTSTQSLTVLYTDTFGCTYIDSTHTNYYALPQTNLKDSTYCGSETVLLPGDFDQYLWNTDDTSSSLFINSNGVYTLRVRDRNGCEKLDSATISFLNSNTFSLGTDVVNCGSYLLTSPSSTGNSWSTGSTSDRIVVGQSGTYSLILTDAFDCVAVDSIDITIHPVPSQSWPDTLSFCSNDLVTISSDSFSSYLWNNGSTSRTVLAGNGPHLVTATNSFGCVGKDTVYVRINAIPQINLGADTAVCGSSLEITAPAGSNYQWQSGNSTQTEVATSSGTYWLDYTDFNGCVTSDTVLVTLWANNLVPTLTQNGNFINSNVGGSHLWFIDGMLDGTTDSFIFIKTLGTYQATSVDSNGCVSDTSNSITKTASVNNIGSSLLKVYPNPTNGKVTIEATGLGNIQSIKLYDTNGKLVENTQTINGAAIDLSWQARSGIYWIVVTTDRGVYRAEVMSVR